MDDKKQKYAYWLRPSLFLQMESALDKASVKRNSCYVALELTVEIYYNQYYNHQNL